MSADKFQKSEAVSLVPAALTAASEKKGESLSPQGAVERTRRNPGGNGLDCPRSTAGGKR